MKPLAGMVVVTVSAAMGLGLGYLWRRVPTGNDAGSVRQGNGAAWSDRAASRSAAVAEIDHSPEAELAREMAMPTGVFRWLHWFEALENATPADFPRLARLAPANTTALRLLAMRWNELDPQGLFAALVTAEKDRGSAFFDSIQYGILSDWCKRDPKSLIKAMNEAPLFGRRAQWRRDIAVRVCESDPELGMSLMQEWGIWDHHPRSEPFKEWAAADPRHAAETMVTYPLGDVTRSLAETVGSEWGRIDPVGALQFASTRRDEYGSVLGLAALKAWSERDLIQAGEWLANADASTRKRLSPAFVEVWAKSDPAGALTWCEDNLTGSSLSQAAAGVLKGAAAKDLSTAARLVEVMKPSSARTAGALAVAEQWVPYSEGRKPFPAEVIAWMKKLDHETQRQLLGESQFRWRWSENDPASLAQFLEETPVSGIQQHVYSHLARLLARKDPREAMEWAQRLPQDHAKVEAAGEAFSEWVRTQPDPAIDWLKRLPENNQQRKAFFETAVRKLAWDQHATEKLAALAGNDLATARSVIEKMGLPAENRERVLSVLGGRAP